MPFKFADELDDFSEGIEQDNALEDSRPGPTHISQIDLHAPGTTLFYGKTMSGKSVLMRNLLNRYARMQRYSAIFVFCGSISEDWNCVDKRYVFQCDKQMDDRLRMVIKMAEKLKKEGKHTLVILDDVFNGKEHFHNNPLWDELASQSRHCLISIWMSVHNPGHIPPMIKSNVSGYFVTKVSRQALTQVFQYSYGFENVTQFVNYVDSNVKLGHVFYNDCRDAFAESPFAFVDVPLPPKFLIRMK